MRQQKITIIFHNPNPVPELAEELVKIAAEVVAEKVRQDIIYSEQKNIQYEAT